MLPYASPILPEAHGEEQSAANCLEIKGKGLTDKSQLVRRRRQMVTELWFVRNLDYAQSPENRVKLCFFLHTFHLKVRFFPPFSLALL